MAESEGLKVECEITGVDDGQTACKYIYNVAKGLRDGTIHEITIGDVAYQRIMTVAEALRLALQRQAAGG